MKLYHVTAPNYLDNVIVLDDALMELSKEAYKDKRTALVVSGEALLRIHGEEDGKQKLL
jgi:hypothetical protein